MRAITVRQPWAWAIVHGGKDVENRSRNIAGAYRGLVAIHAGLTIDLDAVDSLTFRQAWHREFMPETLNPDGGGYLPSLSDVAEGDDEALPIGAIIGVIDLTDVHWSGMECSRGNIPCHEYGLCSPWSQAYHHHLVTANPRPLTRPVPARGRLGLWTLPADVEAAVLEQVTSNA